MAATLNYISSSLDGAFILYVPHGSVTVFIGFVVGQGQYGTVLRLEYNQVYITGCDGGGSWYSWKSLY